MLHFRLQGGDRRGGNIGRIGDHARQGIDVVEPRRLQGRKPRTVVKFNAIAHAAMSRILGRHSQRRRTAIYRVNLRLGEFRRQGDRRRLS